MLIMVVVEERTKRARRIVVDVFLKEIVNQELKKNFSEELAKTVTAEIMETVKYTKGIDCIVRCDNKLYSFDLKSKVIEEILLETILPTQTTDFGEYAFAVALEELKKIVMDFTYGTDIFEVIENPRIEGVLFSRPEVYSLSDINSKKISSILREYFSEESEKNLTEELKEYLNIENSIANLNTREGIYYLVTHGNNKPTLERPEHFFGNKGLVNIIKPYLKGYVKALNEINARIHNYIYYGITEKMDGIVLGGCSDYLVIELEFEGKKIPAIGFSEFKYKKWYSAKPLCMTAKNVFQLLKENSNCEVNSYAEKIEKIKKIMGELKIDGYDSADKQKERVGFSYKKDNDKERYYMDMKSTGDYLHCAYRYQDGDTWNKFKKDYEKKFEESLDDKEFYVYFIIYKE